MIDGQTLMMVVGVVGLAIGSFYGGRRAALVENSTIASDTVEMLTVQVNALKEANADLLGRLANQDDRIKMLESLVTQKAEVAQVLATVTRIEGRMNAQA
jgi:hypothetical protein